MLSSAPEGHLREEGEKPTEAPPRMASIKRTIALVTQLWAQGD